MLRLLSDENIHGDIVRGIRRKQPDLDIVRAQDVGLMAVADPRILEWAAAKSGAAQASKRVGWRKRKKTYAAEAGDPAMSTETIELVEESLAETVASKLLDTIVGRPRARSMLLRSPTGNGPVDFEAVKAAVENRREERVGELRKLGLRVEAAVTAKGVLVTVEERTFHDLAAGRDALVVARSGPDTELETYLRELPRLLEEGHAGRHALVRGDEVLSIWDTERDVLQAGYERFGLDYFMVKRIDARDPARMAAIRAKGAAACPS